MHWLETAKPSVLRLKSAFERSNVSLTLADMTLPDSPLIAINEPFRRMTGYDPQQALGRNCRFLQPAGGAGPVRARIRSFMKDEAQEEGRFIVPNVSRGGRPFLNLVYISKMRIDGRFTFALGSQFDITGKDKRMADIYDTALRQDVLSLGKLAGEYGIVMLGTYDSLASSHSIIARNRITSQEDHL
ncbi:PAS domain-containing protein [Paraurantiacibacter namhicola]|uniref:Blue-light-activated histidine kinase n=1 Tax=Paraurantiacibacter namhicola TaxID=645517 RepID=A0A1C7D6U5_9SPHN|nr:PAS domain-containing protein [Paraurantiacibacter namhicola]ANU07051.1 Blue-light-activated histidine kinase [Paraurantiacibacter namhicola]